MELAEKNKRSKRRDQSKKKPNKLHCEQCEKEGIGLIKYLTSYPIFIECVSNKVI